MNATYWVSTLVTILVTIIASGGFWTHLQRKGERKSATTKLLLALAYNQIVTDGMVYIERGWLTKDEYDDFMRYLWKPYSEFGGNGIAAKIVEEVRKLPVRNR